MSCVISPVRLAVLGMERKHLELLPALFKDPQVDICWVYTNDSESAMAHLASLFSFPIVTDPPDSETLHDLDILVRPESGSIRFEPASNNGLSIISDHQLASIRRRNGFAWEEVIVTDPEQATNLSIDDQTTSQTEQPAETPDSGEPAPPPEMESCMSEAAADDSLWVQGMTCNPSRGMPDDLPAWFHRLVNPKRLGAWLCDQIDNKLQTPLPCVLVLTDSRRILGVFDAMGRPGSQMRRSVYRFMKLTSQMNFTSANFDLLQSDQPVIGPFNLSQLPIDSLDHCGFRRSGTHVFRMALQKNRSAWLLYFNANGKISGEEQQPILPAVIRRTFAEQRMALETLTKLTIKNEQARQWRMLQSMGRKLNLVSRSFNEIVQTRSGNGSERFDD